MQLFITLYILCLKKKKYNIYNIKINLIDIMIKFKKY